MKIIVIGGTGLIGSKVVAKLQAPSFEDTAVLAFFEPLARYYGAVLHERTLIPDNARLGEIRFDAWVAPQSDSEGPHFIQRRLVPSTGRCPIP